MYSNIYKLEETPEKLRYLTINRCFNSPSDYVKFRISQNILELNSPIIPSIAFMSFYKECFWDRQVLGVWCLDDVIFYIYFIFIYSDPSGSFQTLLPRIKPFNRQSIVVVMF